METTPRYIEWISPEEMHKTTLSWVSELKFARDEQLFLNSLVKSYTPELIEQDIYDKSKELVVGILDAENELKGLLKEVQVHENQLEIMIDDVDQPKMEKAYRDSHLDLVKRMDTYLVGYRSLKKQLFELLSQIIKKGKQDRLLN